MKKAALVAATIMIFALLGWRITHSGQTAAPARALGPDDVLQQANSSMPNASLQAARKERVERTIEVEAEGAAEPNRASPAVEDFPPIRIQVQVQDTAGHAIPGAVAYGTQSLVPLALPTDSRGRTELDLTFLRFEYLNVVALGYCLGGVARSGNDDLQVVLQRCGQVTVLLQSTGLESGVLPNLRVDYQAPLFGETFSGPHSAYGLVHGCTVASGSRGGPDYAAVVLNAHPWGIISSDMTSGVRYVISGLNPGVPFDLKVIDSFNQILLTHPEPALFKEEWREVRIVTPAALRSLTGRVLDPRGQPLKVRVGLKGGNYVGTDPLGYFQFHGVGTVSVSLKIDHRKFADLRVHVQVPADGNLGDLTMEFRSELNVFVRDENGDPVRATVRANYDESRWADADTQSEGHYRFSTLGSGEIEIEIRAAGRRYLRLVSPGKTQNFDVTLPVHGVLEVHVPEIPGVDPDTLRVVVPLDEVDLIPPSAYLKTLPCVVQISPLLPGEIGLRLETYVAEPEYRWVPLSETLSAQIRPGETTSVQLTPN